MKQIFIFCFSIICICSGCTSQQEFGDLSASELKTLIVKLNILLEEKEREKERIDSLSAAHIRQDSIQRFNEVLDSINHSIIKDRALADLSSGLFVYTPTAIALDIKNDPGTDAPSKASLGINENQLSISSSSNTNTNSASVNSYTFNHEVDSIVWLSGNVIGEADKYVQVYQSRPYEDDYKRTIKINAEKGFKKEIVLKEPGFYTFTHKKNKYNIFLVPGDTLDITVDHDTDEGLSFSGKSADANNYLRCKALQDKAMAPNEWRLMRKEFVDFEDDINYFKEVRQNNLNEFLNKAPLVSEKFKIFEETDINFKWARDHVKYQKQNKENSDAKFAANNDFMKSLSFKNDEVFQIYNYRKFLYEYFDFNSKKYIEKKHGKDGQYNFPPEERAMMQYKRINKMFKSKKVRSFLKTDLVYEKIKEFKKPYVNPLVISSRKDIDYEPYEKVINNQYKKYVPLDDGAFAPDFTLTDRSGNTKELKDFRGKWLYIAVWASWCAPCKIEQPHLERLKSEYKRNRNIEIISVSIDEKKSKWERALDFRDITGPQYIAPGNWNSSFCKAFNVRSVPKYILIDPKGQIVDLSTSKPSADIRIKLDHYGVSSI